MRLPKWLWRLIRSKRVHRFLAIAPFVAVVGVVVFYWGVNRWGQGKIDATLEQLRGMNIPMQPDLPSPEDGLVEVQKRSFREALRIIHPGKVFIAMGFRRPAYSEYVNGTSPNPFADLRGAMIRPEPGLTQKLLAENLVSKLQTQRRKVDELMADWGLLNPSVSTSDNHPNYAAQIAGWSGNFLIFHSSLLAESGDSDGAVRDFILAIHLVDVWQDPTPYWWWVDDTVLQRAVEGLPLLIANLRSNPRQLGKLDSALASVDSVLPYLQAEECRLHRLCHTYAEDEHITNQPISVGLSDLTWGDGWGKRRATLADWWWEAKPIGYRQANLAEDVESLVPILRGLPEAADPHFFTFADLKSYKFHIDPRTHAFSSPWSDNWDDWTYIQDGLGLSMLRILHLRFHRLSIAAELHRHKTGTYPESIEALTIDPLISPFDGEPIQLRRLPDERLQFKAVGATLLPDGTLHFDPETPITFDYPPNP